MPKKFFKKILPEPEELKNSKALSWISHLLADGRLWHFNRHSVATAVFIGLFCAFLPIPFQMFVAAVLAIGLHANVGISVVLVWISNPLTMPVLFYGAYLFGATLLGVESTPLPDELSLQWLQDEIAQAWQPFLLGCVMTGLSLATIGYVAAKYFWRAHVIKTWRNRSKKSS